MAPDVDPVLVAFNDGGIAGVAEHLGLDDLDAARQEFHLAMRRSDADIREAGLGHLLDGTDGPPELDGR